MVVTRFTVSGHVTSGIMRTEQQTKGDEENLALLEAVFV
jgi:hypothetical protein